jgi:hypothetical protein
MKSFWDCVPFTEGATRIGDHEKIKPSIFSTDDSSSQHTYTHYSYYSYYSHYFHWFADCLLVCGQHGRDRNRPDFHFPWSSAMPYERSQKQCLWCEFSYTFILITAAYTGPRTYTANWVVVLHVDDATAPGNGWSARTGTVTVNGKLT